MMKAIARDSKSGKIELIEVPMPKAGPGEVVVKVFHAGICKTDLKVADGSLAAKKDKIILGHEFSGQVVEVGPECNDKETASKIGDFVVANPMLNSTTDEMLGKDIDGCFAEYVVVPASNLFLVKTMSLLDKMPKSIKKLAAYCEPVAAARSIAPKIPCYYLEDVVIAGDPNDRIAKLLKFCINSSGKTVGNPARLEIVDPERLILEIELGKRSMPECIIECCPSMIGKLVKCVAPGGTIILKSRGYDSLENLLVNDIVMREISLVGAKYDGFYSAIDFILENRDELLPMIDERDFKLEEFEKAFEEAKKPNAKKVMFKCAQ